MRLSDNFTVEEMTFSETAARLGLNNAPDDKVIDHLHDLCAYVLEPLRERIGRPIFVTSGYRSQAVNDQVHGSPHSDHIRGCAADIRCPPVSAQTLMREIVRASHGLPLKQVICEFGRWVHVSYDIECEVPEFLVATNYDGVTTYARWS